MSAAKPEARVKCPACEAHTMVHHCSSKHCPVWFRCQNVECEAVLDGKRGIGYRKHPAGLREHPAGPVKRVRMIRLGGVWLVRDAA